MTIKKKKKNQTKMAKRSSESNIIIHYGTKKNVFRISLELQVKPYTKDPYVWESQGINRSDSI